MSEPSGRHYGLDWLRIGAFGLLIFYHIGMFFVHWPWHVKTADPLEWVAVPMLALNPWRLALLFVVSGYASRIMLERRPGGGRFVKDRTGRLLIPVIVAMTVINPPQPFVELVTQHGYTRSFIDFWRTDYFAFKELDGLAMPTWQHLWFVVYLWSYSLLLALLTLIGIDRLQRVYDRIFGGIGLLTIPLVWALLVTLLLFVGQGSTNALFGDWAGHAVFLPAFLFGVGLGGSRYVLATARRLWKPALVMAVAGYAVIATFEIIWPGFEKPPQIYIDIARVARPLQGWMTIVALLGIADKFWNRDHPWRATLTEAVAARTDFRSARHTCARLVEVRQCRACDFVSTGSAQGSWTGGHAENGRRKHRGLSRESWQVARDSAYALALGDPCRPKGKRADYD